MCLPAPSSDLFPCWPLLPLLHWPAQRTHWEDSFHTRKHAHLATHLSEAPSRSSSKSFHKGEWDWPALDFDPLRLMLMARLKSRFNHNRSLLCNTPYNRCTIATVPLPFSLRIPPLTAQECGALSRSSRTRSRSAQRGAPECPARQDPRVGGKYEGAPLPSGLRLAAGRHLPLPAVRDEQLRSHLR